jgi:hypothetical protein
LQRCPGLRNRVSLLVDNHIIALVGWKHPKYNMFCQRTGKCRATQYESLWHTTVARERKTNSNIFVTYLEEIQEKVAETWRIPPEVVEEYKKIANFKASRHNMWIQEKRDPEKEWLQMRYCVTVEEVQWEMKDWKEEWKVPIFSVRLDQSRGDTCHHWKGDTWHGMTSASYGG